MKTKLLREFAGCDAPVLQAKPLKPTTSLGKTRDFEYAGQGAGMVKDSYATRGYSVKLSKLLLAPVKADNGQR